MKSGKATIADIASAAGVGIGTVDRVLHNRGRVSAETYARVMAIVEKLEYQPNKAAQLLARREPCKIAIIYNLTVNSFWESVKKGIDDAQREFSQYGVEITRFEMPEIDVDKEAEIIDKVISEGYEGIAIVPFHSDKVLKAIDRAVEQGIYVVTFNNDEACKRHCYIGQNLYQGGRTAGRIMSMLAPKCARIMAIVPVIEIMSSMEQRYLGFKHCLSQLRNDVILIENFIYEEIEKDKMLDFIEASKCDAIYVSSAHVEEVGSLIEESGFSRHIPLIGHDDTVQIREYIRNDIIDAAIGQEQNIQGYKAIEILCDYLIFNKVVSSDKYYTKIEILVKENL